MNRKAVLSGMAVALLWCLAAPALAQTVDDLVARNVAARGGAETWRAISSIRFTGQMDVGRGMHVPYLLEQKRPRKMRLELVFDGQTAVQCSDGKTGWKVAPFRGKKTPERLTDQEMRDAAGMADLDGLLFDYAERGLALTLIGREPIEGLDTFKLQVTLPGGSVRWVYLDAVTGLEVKVDAVRTIAGRQQRVETYYSDWRPASGLLIPRRLEARAEGMTGAQVITVETVRLNPVLDDARFTMPAAPAAGGGTAR